MRERGKKLTVAAVLAAMALGGPMYFIARAADPAPKADAKPAKRDPQAILAELQAQGMELHKVIDSADVLTKHDKRAQAAPKAIPIIKKMIPLFDELGAAEPDAKADMGRAKLQFLAMLKAFGDEETSKDLEKQAASASADESDGARTAQLMANWWLTDGKAEDQAKIVGELSKQAKAHPKSDNLAQVAMMFSQSAANKEIEHQAGDVILNDLNGDAAKDLAEGVQAERKLQSLEGKPLTLAGKTVDGKDFSSDTYKGKVVLVDFWATWCGPCREELPRVKKAYKDFHEKGLEVLGVSCDRKDADLKGFLKENPDMPWTQLFDAGKPGWHELATQYGINGIPTMFLIDKKGVVRTVKARENFEDLIPKMLAE